ncbi:heterokaryon incompatibility protein-domain-containing protein [Pseudoneurospora amorphoporcata]|uniref:Heterokaryon incompatibility protein-domain-containing protein n=1 Tax=Pseudoneurospora amorphoporcata TaxID=241081 RepID=A0AAN6SDD7_9PEZI|nr:heterokaryon incompatibility protein-domain-containing protein [Pseudoneurospora amorphoporcata]
MGELSPCKWCGHPPTSGVSLSVFRSSLIAMEANASKCRTCSIFFTGIRKYLSNTSLPVPNDVDHVAVILGKLAVGKGMAVEIPLGPSFLKLSFFCSEETSWMTQTLPFLEIGKQVPKTTSSDESLSWAIQQINHCTDGHQDCNSYSSAAVLPKRVVFVGTTAEPALRLYESQAETDPYVCLSYCWGRRPFHRTLVDNLESHKRCIKPDHLPPTMNDAIEYTRRLGVRYIWIDSLCIIQDSLLDWREEAGKMASIFQRSFLVLSATCSADAYGGIHASPPSDYQTFALKVNTKTNQVCNSDGADQANLTMTTNDTETIYVRRAYVHVRRGTSCYASQFPMLPTLKRGWIFQERFLSSRILHFGPHELYFECLEDSACQCTDHSNSSLDRESVLGSKGGVNETTTPRESPADKYQQHSSMRKTLAKAYYGPVLWRIMSHDELICVWHRLVHDYTRRELTYEKDLFPAISGLAREMSVARAARAARDADEDMVKETVYFAGLWKDSLVRDLCWKVGFENTATDDKDEVKRIKAWTDRALEWRAPTWSWGSVNAPVKFLGQRYDTKDFLKPLCEVLDVSCTAAGSDEMGELIAGRLVLRGLLLPARVTRPRLKTQREDGLRLPWQILSLDFGLVVENFAQHLFVDDGCQDLLRLLDEVEAGDDQHRPIVYCFLLGIVRRGGSPVFLLLKKAKGQSEEKMMGQNVYHRFGRLQLTGPPRRPKNDHTPWKERFGVFAQAKEKVVTII